MNSRERVLTAFKRIHGLPDRIPVQFDICRQLSVLFGKELGILVKPPTSKLRTIHLI